MNTPANEKKCPYPDCPKVKYRECSIHGEDMNTPTNEKLRNFTQTIGTPTQKLDFTPANEWREEVKSIKDVDEAFEGSGPIPRGSIAEIVGWGAVEELIQKTLDQQSAHLVERLEALKKKVKVCDNQQSYPMCSNCEGGYSECLWAREDNKHNQALDQAIDIIRDKNG